MKHNKKIYKWSIYCNIGNVAWGFHWKDSQNKWKEKQIKNKYVYFADSATNALVYFSYIKVTSEKYADKQKVEWDNKIVNNFISLHEFSLTHNY